MGFRKFIDPLLTTACICCGKAVTGREDLCSKCRQQLPFAHFHCFRCGEKLAESAELCGKCINSDSWLFERCVPLLEYREQAIRLMSELKYHNQLAVGRTLGLVFADKLQRAYLQNPLPELIVPVPLHRIRLRARGYNQSDEIARIIAGELNIAADSKLCKRHRNTASQTQMGEKMRRQNLADAFRARALDNVRSMAIIDDVVTSGATANALAAELKVHSKQLQLHLWCLARA